MGLAAWELPPGRAGGVSLPVGAVCRGERGRAVLGKRFDGVAVNEDAEANGVGVVGGKWSVVVNWRSPSFTGGPFERDAADVESNFGGVGGIDFGFDVEGVACEVFEKIAAGVEGLSADVFLLVAQGFNFFNRELGQADALPASDGLEFQFAGDAHLLVEGHLGKSRVAHPADAEAAAIRGIGPGLCGVIVFAPVEDEGPGLVGEGLAVEGPG